MINANQVRPFIAVMPPGGLPAGTKQQRAQSEWAGPSEDFVVRTVVPWVDTHLPTIRAQRARAIADGRVVGGVFPAVPGRAVRTRVGREACRTRPGAAAQPRRGDFAATVSGSSSQRAAATGPSSGAGRSSSSANCAPSRLWSQPPGGARLRAQPAALGAEIRGANRLLSRGHRRGLATEAAVSQLAELGEREEDDRAKQTDAPLRARQRHRVEDPLQRAE